MADRYLLFKALMIRALLANRKTQTRRLPTQLPRFGKITEFGRSDTTGYDWHFRDKEKRWHDLRHEELLKVLPWSVGDRIIVRETWQTGTGHDGPKITFKATPDYFNIDAWDGEDFGAGPSFNYERCPNATWHTWLPDLVSGTDGSWRPSIHMPRWASRLTLIITDIRIERLQDICEEDAVAEGCFKGKATRRVFNNETEMRLGGAEWSCARDWYADLFERINGAGSWDANPWVFALTFTVHHCNVDALCEAVS